MMNAYSTHTSDEQQEMLADIGISDMSALFANIPDTLTLKKSLNLPPAASEWAVVSHLRKLSEMNATTHTHLNFMGAGHYEHYIPAVIDAIISRGEFLTSYTPYQPEMSQGLLQALYEYQLCISVITGLPVVNSSCYDAATALADATWMACLIKANPSQNDEAQKILLSEAIWPDHQNVLETYFQERNANFTKMPTGMSEGQKSSQSSSQTDLKKLEDEFKKQAPDVFVCQQPNALGVIEDVKAIAELCQKYNVISVLSYNPLLSGLMQTPGELGCDIVCGNGQVLGIPLRAGGSGLGILATKKQYRKYMPGRMVGKVSDIKGNLAYALIYEDREQHVAREKATSNICSNQALNAIRAGIYLSSMGGTGLEKIAALNVTKARYLCEECCKINGVKRYGEGEFFNEFVLQLSRPVKEIQNRLLEKKIFAGIELDTGTEPDAGIESGKDKKENLLLVTATELKSKNELDQFVDGLKEVLEEASK